MMKSAWYKAKVIHGKKLATTLGFPTLNLDNPDVMAGEREGVYACWLKVDKKIYKGALYYGPRLILNETAKILEIYVFDFDKEIYGKEVSFQLVDFIRGVRNFPDFASFKKQLTLDCQKAQDLLK